jgi:hypothetical protein
MHFINCHFITYRPYSDKNNKDKLDRHEDFLSWKRYGRIEGWSARKTFQPGDLVIFYFAQPLMTNAAVAVVDTDPYYIELDYPTDFSNLVFCDYYPVIFLKKEVPIKDLIAAQPLIARWWKTKPYQSIRRIDPTVALALLQGIAVRNLENKYDLAPFINMLSQPVADTPTKPKKAKATPPTPKAKTTPPPKRKNWTKRDLLQLPWRQFEELIAELFSHIHNNATVKLSPGRADQGVDVFITNNKTGKVQIIQCKRFRTNKVTSPDMQKFAGAMIKFKATKAYFITTSSFNHHAIDFAHDIDNLELIEYKQLLKMINNDGRIPSCQEFQNRN